MNLTKEDYINILDYYNVKYSKNLPINLLRNSAEKIISEKLCRCIKKVPNKNKPESRAIGICNYSVIKRKNLKINGFTCKKRPQLKASKFSKKRNNKLTKTVNTRIHLKSKKIQ
tara:strand:- start:67 stop:408 length:342 start_codon:yes stop_codon:yes gene_type:complete